MSIMKSLLQQVSEAKGEIEMSMTWKEFSLSSSCYRYLTSIATVLTKAWGRQREVIVTYDESPDAPVAYTDGASAHLNAANELVGWYGSFSQKLLCLLGILVHECAHILYMDFDYERKMIEARESGKWVPTRPVPEDTEAQKALEEMEDYMKNRPVTKKVLVNIVHSLSNIFADVHDEAAMSIDHPGLCKTSLSYSAMAMREQTPFHEDRIEKGVSDPLSLMLSMILSFARYDTLFLRDPLTSDEYTDKMVDLMDAIRIGRATDNMDLKNDSMNRVLIGLWSYIKPLIEKYEEESELMRVLAEAMAEAMEGLGTPMPSPGDPSGKPIEGGGHSDTALSSEVSESTSSKSRKSSTDSGSPEAEEAMEKTVSKIKEETAISKAEAKVEEKRSDAENAIIRSVDGGTLHAGISPNYRRKSDVTDDMRRDYERIYDEIKPYSKALQRGVMNVLKERRAGGKAYGKPYGRRFEGRCASRIDGKYFSQTKQPGNKDEMACAFLIDESGSMNGERIRAARRAAVLLEDFTSALEIPTLICGHSTEGRRDFSLYAYSEFDKVNSKKDKYRLADIHARSQNRDGLALKIMCERLVKRTEDVKMLIIVSDGQPADYDYGGESAIREMQAIVKEYTRKGITIFAAAIGSDKPQIHKIYGDGFLDVSDLSKLPRTLTNLIKKRVI